MGKAAEVAYVKGTRVMARRDGILRLSMTIKQGDTFVESVTHMSVRVHGSRHLDGDVTPY